MPKFIRRQMPIDAVQYDGTPESRVAIKHLAAGFVDADAKTPTLSGSIGDNPLYPGDWVVHEKISKDFPFTVFTPQAFQATFEPER